MSLTWKRHRDGLLQAGGDVDSRIDGYTPLLLALQQRDAIAAHQLIDMGADVNLMTPHGESALYLSMGLPRVTGVIAAIVEAGADLNVHYPSGDTPLIDALDYWSDELAKYLLAHGPSVNQRSTSGSTALYVASIEGLKDVVRLLLNGGADVNMTVSDSDEEYEWEDTPLNTALANGHYEIAEMFLAEDANMDANINVASSDGTPLTISAYAGQPNITQSLLRKNALVNVAKDLTIRDDLSGYHMDLCVPACYVLLYIAGQQLNYFDSLDFLQEFIDRDFEWFLHKILLPAHVSNRSRNTYLRNYVYYEEGDIVRRGQQNESDRERASQFIDEILQKNFKLKAICRWWVRKHLVGSASRHNVFMKVACLVRIGKIPSLLGQYLLYGYQLEEDITQMDDGLIRSDYM